MNQLYSLEVTLTVLGPFLTATTGGGGYGVHKAFHRAHNGDLVVPASHIKGKVRWALEELAPYFDADVRPPLDQWFGAVSANNEYTPIPGMLHFSDMKCRSEKQAVTRTRVVIHPIAGTSAENLLREIEDPYASGSKIECVGTVSYYASELTVAKQIAATLNVGLKWLANLGAEKGVGYGRLAAVRISEPIIQVTSPTDTVNFDSGTSLHLRITPLEPLLIGGVKSRRTNLVQAQREILGGVIKGALAAALNRTYGIEPVHRKMDASSVSDFPDYPTLVAHYAQICVSHALPVYVGQPRPIRIPISTVKHAGKLWDTALSPESFPISQGQAPQYFIDWKDKDTYFGIAQPSEIFVTRSEVDNVSQRTLEGQLFTYSFHCPNDEQGRAIEWVSNVDFSAITDTDVRTQVKKEFAQAVQRHLTHLGKLGRAVRIEVYDDKAPNAQPTKQLGEDGLAIITLQSDAIMLDPAQVHSLGVGEDLHALYADFWSDLCGNNPSAPCMELVDFYAHQCFYGGYLYHRYLGTIERDQAPNRYRPYYVTSAGSVFKLRVLDEQVATQLLARWQSRGIPLPQWARNEYGQYGTEIWESCPFVPENGYGEIVVNLEWHWTNRL